MGNNATKEYKNNYIQGNYKIIKQLNNDLLGTHYLIYLLEPSQYFYMKTIDPNKYNNYTCDIDWFIEKIKYTNKNVSKFYFLTTNKYNEEMFDIVFEYNPTLFDLIITQNKTIFKSEKEIWLLIEDILEAFIFFEDKNEHLKELNLNSICLKSGKDFCIINPYLFENYFDDVLGIYLNKNLDTKIFNKKNINKNLIEFGLILIKLITKDYDTNIDINKPMESLKNFKNKISKKMYNLLTLIFNKEYKFLFSEIKSFLINGEKENDIFDKILSKNNNQTVIKNKKEEIKKNSIINKKKSDKDEQIKLSLPNQKQKQSILKKMKSNEVNSINNLSKKWYKAKSGDNWKSEKKNSKITTKSKNLVKNSKKETNKPSSLKNIDNKITEKNKSKLNLPNTFDKPSLMNYSRESLSKNNDRNSLSSNYNKNICINLINESGKFSNLFKIEDSFDKKRNDYLFKSINNKVNWNSKLKESIYHKKLNQKNSFVID